MPTKDVLVSELHSLEASLKGLLDEAKENAKISNDYFVAHGIKKLAPFCGYYYTTLCNLGVKTKAQMEELFGRFFKFQEVQAAVDNLLETEASWNQFLKDMDKKIYGSNDGEDKLQVGAKGPLDHAVVDTETEWYNYNQYT